MFLVQFQAAHVQKDIQARYACAVEQLSVWLTVVTKAEITGNLQHHILKEGSFHLCQI